MDAEKEELIRHLFSELTGSLESAHALSVEGQALALRSSGSRDIAKKALVLIKNATVLAECIAQIAMDRPIP